MTLSVCHARDFRYDDRIPKRRTDVNAARSKNLIGFRVAIPRPLFIGIAFSATVVLMVTWWVIWYVGVFPEAFFPGPHHVFSSGIRMLFVEDFSRDILASVARILVAFIVSALLAIPLGFLMSCFKPAEAFVEPMIDFVRYVPVPALLPLFVLWTGIGETPKFLVLFFGTFFQLVLLIKDDADNVKPINFDLARTMGASSIQLIRDVLFPAMLPHIYDRLRVTLGWCWTYLVIAELVAVEKGVGFTIKEAQRFSASDRLFVCFIVLGLIGLFTDLTAKFLFHRLFPYAGKLRA